MPEELKLALLIIGSILMLLIFVILIRTITFKDKETYNKNRDEIIPHDDIVHKLGQMLKVPTVTYEDRPRDEEEFKKFIEVARNLYPNVFNKCEVTITEDLAIKLKLAGKSDEKPTVLMAHYDVVPVTEGWKHDPFLGEVVEGYLYGRGALDTKNTMACALNALEHALNDGYVPQNDLYLCFGSNEEIIGDSQLKLVREFEKNNIHPALVFDEGGGVLSNAFPTVKEDVAFLGVVEKGMCNIELSIETNGGHSSTPRKNGPAIRMAKALIKLEKNQMKPKLINTTKEMLDKLGRHTSFGLKMIFANMWLFKGLVKKLFTKISADTRALLQTTFAFTILNGGNQTNIIPNKVTANINVRVAPWNTVEEVVNHIKKTIKDDDIKVNVVTQVKIYDECSTKEAGYDLIKEVTAQTFENTVISPFIMLGGTDAKHYNEISDCVIRFSPMRVTAQDRKTIHGLDEKIKVEELLKCQEFYQRLLLKLK